jgi:hypothetical protein
MILKIHTTRSSTILNRGTEIREVDLLTRRLFKLALIIFCLFVQTSLCQAIDGVCAKNAHLFYIERNVNKNLVYYDVCLKDNNDLADSNPVSAYWELDKGRKIPLGVVARLFAYGISVKGRPAKNRIIFTIAAINQLSITVEQTEGRYQAVASVNNRDIIIERVYVFAEKRFVGFPEVIYVDIYGRTLNGNVPAKERIAPA